MTLPRANHIDRHTTALYIKGEGNVDIVFSSGIVGTHAGPASKVHP